MDDLAMGPLEAVPQPVTLACSGFAIRNHGLFVIAPEVTIGTPRDSVHVPVLAQLRRRHALVLRDQGQYYLMPNSDCAAWIGQKHVTQRTPLEPGHEIALGRPSVRWKVLITDPDSQTAVLQQVWPSNPLVITPDGSLFSRIILLGQCACVSRSPFAHLPIPGFLSGELRFLRHGSGITVRCTGATLANSAPGESGCLMQTDQLLVPSTLQVRFEPSEISVLARALEGGHVDPDLALSVIDPYRREPAT